jgi:hypothetical protein
VPKPANFNKSGFKELAGARQVAVSLDETHSIYSNN